MKRALCLILVLSFLLSCVTVSASASYTGTVLRGTPTVDGMMDEIYASSCDFYLGRNPSYIGVNPKNGGEALTPLTDGHCYVLWDDNYVYFYCLVYDDDLNAGDSANLFFNYSGVAWCVQYSPVTGKITWPEQTASYAYFDQSKSYASCYINEAEGYYAVEYAMKLNGVAVGVAQGFYFCAVEGYNGAEIQSTSGVFFEDYLSYSSKSATASACPILQIKPQSTLIQKNGYWYGVLPEQPVQALIDSFAQTVTVTDASGKAVDSIACVKTGLKVKDRSGKSVSLVLEGDVNGNGIIESNDFLRISAIVKNSTLASLCPAGSVYRAAADINENKSVDSNDYIRLRAYYLGIISTIFCGGVPTDASYCASLSLGEHTDGFFENGDTSAYFAPGETVSFTAYADEEYQIDSVTVNGTEIDFVKNNDSISCRFTMPAGAVTVAVNAAPISYPISVFAATGGSVTFTTADAAPIGQTVSFTVTPQACYAVSSLIINGVSAEIKNNGGTASYEITVNNSHPTISVSFLKDSYLASADPVSAGSVLFSNGSGSVSAKAGETVTFTVQPSTGYTVSAVHVGDTSLRVLNSGRSAQYSFTMPADDVSVSVTFQVKKYSAYLSYTGEGSAVFDNGITSASFSFGSELAFTVTPAEGYRVASVKTNGTTIPVLNNGEAAVYRIVTPASVLSITVTFSDQTVLASLQTQGHGTADFPSGQTSFPVFPGNGLSLTVTPDSGYYVKSVTVNGTALEILNNGYEAVYEITVGDTDTVVSVLFDALPGEVITLSGNACLAINGYDSIITKISAAAQTAEYFILPISEQIFNKLTAADSREVVYGNYVSSASDEPSYYLYHYFDLTLSPDNGTLVSGKTAGLSFFTQKAVSTTTGLADCYNLGIYCPKGTNGSALGKVSFVLDGDYRLIVSIDKIGTLTAVSGDPTAFRNSLRIGAYADATAGLTSYAPSIISQKEWCGSVKTDTANHIMAADCSETAGYFGGDSNTYFGGFDMNSFCAGMYTDGKRMNVSDPLYQATFINALYDYTYPVIFFSVPKSTSESENAYLRGLQTLIRAVREYQPTAKFIFVNFFGYSDCYTRVQRLFSANGYSYWNYSDTPSDFQSDALSYLSGISRTMRTKKPEGAASATDLAETREGMYWIIYDIQDPCEKTAVKDRVLLIGDSICFGYYNNVRTKMAGKAIVDTYAISLTPSDATHILRNLKPMLDKYDYQVIHINIGIHNEVRDNANNHERYGEFLEQILTGIQKMEPGAQVIFATSTPITVSGSSTKYATETNTLIIPRNTIAKQVCAKWNIPVDDLYTLCRTYSPAKADTHHFTSEGNKKLAGWVYDAINKYL